MPEHTMHTSALLLAAALLATLAGTAWLALAMPVHWEQVRGSDALSRRTIGAMRALGVLALLGSLALCLAVDHYTMAALIWIMALAAAALVVAMTLSWRPAWLRAFVVWIPHTRSR